MYPASYRRIVLWQANYASSRELLGFLCVVLLLASAAERLEKPTNFGLLYPPSPRPSGRCPQRPLTFLVHSSQSTVVNQRREG